MLVLGGSGKLPIPPFGQKAMNHFKDSSNSSIGVEF